jgi:flagellar basal-body rod protein FlgF
VIYGYYQSAAGMLTSEYRQAVVANNLANADTVGFKRDIATCAERIPADVAGQRHGPSADNLRGLTGGHWLGWTYTDFSAGSKLATGNAYDVALDGPGFFAVDANGQTQYTRDGRFARREDGVLVATSDGAPVLGRGGAPIHLDPRGGEPSFDTQGRVIQDDTVVGELELADFEDYSALRKTGAARFVAPLNAAVPAPVLVQSGYLEAATVQPINELVDMMDAARTYQMNARMVSLQDESLGRLISVVARA